MGWRVALNEQAEFDLEQVVAFLAKKNPAAAERFGLNLIATIFSLTEMPYRGVAVRGRSDYRHIQHRPWHIVFYRVNGAQQFVEIVRIWDARQDPALLTLE